MTVITHDLDSMYGDHIYKYKEMYTQIDEQISGQVGC